MTQIIQRYFDAFNAGDTDAMLDCLSDSVKHHVNEGKIREGKALFAEFNDHMTRCYKELLTDMVLFEAAGGRRMAAEFVVNGTYLVTDEGLPEARGQTYRLPAGSFFDVDEQGLICRVTTYYNLADWVAQVSA